MRRQCGGKIGEGQVSRHDCGLTALAGDGGADLQWRRRHRAPCCNAPDSAWHPWYQGGCAGRRFPLRFCRRLDGLQLRIEEQVFGFQPLLADAGQCRHTLVRRISWGVEDFPQLFTAQRPHHEISAIAMIPQIDASFGLSRSAWAKIGNMIMRS